MTEKGIPENLIPNADVDGNDILPVLFSPQITVIPSSAISASLIFLLFHPVLFYPKEALSSF